MDCDVAAANILRRYKRWIPCSVDRGINHKKGTKKCINNWLFRKFSVFIFGLNRGPTSKQVWLNLYICNHLQYDGLCILQSWYDRPTKKQLLMQGRDKLMKHTVYTFQILETKCYTNHYTICIQKHKYKKRHTMILKTSFQENSNSSFQAELSKQFWQT